MSRPAAMASGLYKSADGAASIAAGYEALLSHWPVPQQRRHLATSQGETFVIECGMEDRPALLLIHGALGNSAAWISDVATWADHFRIYAVDVIGEPGHSAPSRPPLSSDAYARWLDEVMDGLGLESASLVGISLGGWLGLDFAIRRPARVARLVVISPGGVGAQRNILYWAVPLSLLGAWGRTRVRDLILGPPPSEVTETSRNFAALFELISRQFRPRYDTLPIFTDQQLAALDMPVLAVVAGKDLMLDPVGMKRRLETHVRHLDLRYLPKARHYPGSQATPVLEFLRGRGSTFTAR